MPHPSESVPLERVAAAASKHRKQRDFACAKKAWVNSQETTTWLNTDAPITSRRNQHKPLGCQLIVWIWSPGPLALKGLECPHYSVFRTSGSIGHTEADATNGSTGPNDTKTTENEVDVIRDTLQTVAPLLDASSMHRNASHQGHGSRSRKSHNTHRIFDASCQGAKFTEDMGRMLYVMKLYITKYKYIWVW